MKFAIFLLLMSFSLESAALDCSQAIMKAREEHIKKMDIHIKKLTNLADRVEAEHLAKQTDYIDESMPALTVKLLVKSYDLEEVKNKLVMANLQCDVKLLKQTK